MEQLLKCSAMTFASPRMSGCMLKLPVRLLNRSSRRMCRSAHVKPCSLTGLKGNEYQPLVASGQAFSAGAGSWSLKWRILQTSTYLTHTGQLSPRCEVAGVAGVSSQAGSDSYNYMPDFTDSSVPQKIRAICFYVVTYIVSLPLFVVMLALHPLMLLFDRHRRKAHHFVNKIWATVTISLFYRTQIEGLENLPSENEAAVYVANHQSFLDIYTLLKLGRPFKFISKTSNFMIPIIGWSMYLTGHVPLKRLDKRSQMDCLKKCVDLAKIGVPVLFFPEGTRSADGKMAAFKKGAFTIAAKVKVPVVPISLIGTGKLMPNGLEGTLRPGLVKVVIHPPIRGDDADDLCNQTRAVIAESLEKHGMQVN